MRRLMILRRALRVRSALISERPAADYGALFSGGQRLFGALKWVEQFPTVS